MPLLLLMLLMQPYNTLSGSPSILSNLSLRSRSSSFADDDEPGEEPSIVSGRDQRDR